MSFRIRQNKDFELYLTVSAFQGHSIYIFENIFFTPKQNETTRRRKMCTTCFTYSTRYIFAIQDKTRLFNITIVKTVWVKSLTLGSFIHVLHTLTLLENSTEDAIAQLYVTKFSTISLYLTKIYVTQSFAMGHQPHQNPPKQFYPCLCSQY